MTVGYDIRPAGHWDISKVQQEADGISLKAESGPRVLCLDLSQRHVWRPNCFLSHCHLFVGSILCVPVRVQELSFKVGVANHKNQKSHLLISLFVYHQRSPRLNWPCSFSPPSGGSEQLQPAESTALCISASDHPWGMYVVSLQRYKISHDLTWRQCTII